MKILTTSVEYIIYRYQISEINMNYHSCTPRINLSMLEKVLENVNEFLWNVSYNLLVVNNTYRPILYEQAFQEALRDGGNLAAKYKFANISINGKKWGVMTLEEEVSKEFLEKQRAKDSIVFRFSDDKKRLKHYSDYHSDYRISDEKLFFCFKVFNKLFNKSLISLE